MIILAWIYAVFLALCGVGLVVAGIYAGGGGLVLGIILGVVVAGGAVPFVRSARRMHTGVGTAPVDDGSIRSRRRGTKTVLAAAGVSVVGMLALPVPGVVRGIFIVTTLLAVPLVLIESDDSRRR